MAFEEIRRRIEGSLAEASRAIAKISESLLVLEVASEDETQELEQLRAMRATMKGLLN